jgi:GMP synthase-like glutamine amidotransferase
MFGVCLGLQGMVEYFGGSLGVLDYPMHGKASHVLLDDTTPHAFPVFEGIPNRFEVRTPLPFPTHDGPRLCCVSWGACNQGLRC